MNEEVPVRKGRKGPSERHSGHRKVLEICVMNISPVSLSVFGEASTDPQDSLSR